MRRVLVVDDDASIRRLVRVILADAGFEVIEAEDGARALEVLERESPEILLLDLNMPVMDGWEVFERLREYGRRPRTIIISAGPAERTQQELGAEASLQKPFGPEDLVEKVCALSCAA
jgi:CheY-like chemotaxis protein